MKIKNEFNKYLSKRDLNLLYCIFANSVEVYKGLIKENVQAFSGEYFDSFKGKLLGYIVQKAFDPKLVPNNFHFKINVAKMNFNQRRPEIRIGEIILTIAKGNGKYVLPSYSKYKREYSRGNSGVVTQLYFDFFDEGKIKNLPYYGVIVYEVENYELKELNIFILNNGFTSILDIIPIEFDENTNMDIILNKHKLKDYIQSEIINNPNVVDNY